MDAEIEIIDSYVVQIEVIERKVNEWLKKIVEPYDFVNLEELTLHSQHSSDSTVCYNRGITSVSPKPYAHKYEAPRINRFELQNHSFIPEYEPYSRSRHIVINEPYDISYIFRREEKKEKKGLKKVKSSIGKAFRKFKESIKEAFTSCHRA